MFISLLTPQLSPTQLFLTSTLPDCPLPLLNLPPPSLFLPMQSRPVIDSRKRHGCKTLTYKLSDKLGAPQFWGEPETKPIEHREYKEKKHHHKRSFIPTKESQVKGTLIVAFFIWDFFIPVPTSFPWPKSDINFCHEILLNFKKRFKVIYIIYFEVIYISKEMKIFEHP